MVRHAVIGVCAAAWIAAASGVPFDKPDAIQPYEPNPRYWQYLGEPIVLLGGSREDNLFQIPDIEKHLDLLAATGGNYIRNTMSSRDAGDVWPFAQRDDGKYDLETPNAEYYNRLETCLRIAQARGIIVQIELWDRFDYARDVWERNPFRPVNNVNYTVESSGIKSHYPNHPGTNENPFFYSIPDLKNNETVLQYQVAHVDRVLAISLRYPNVLYCMDNETSGTEEWGTYWAAYIKKKAAEAGTRVNVTEMWDDWNLRSPTHQRTLDHPEQYDFADVSQNNHQKGQAHWDNLQWARHYVSPSPRPLNNVKIYGADGGQFGNARDAEERFWRGLIGGAASVRFHRPDAGIGLSDRARVHIKSARMLCDRYMFFRAEPDRASKRLSSRDENEAYLSVGRMESNVIYFPNGGSIEITLERGMTRGGVSWLNISEARWLDDTIFEGGPSVRLTTPDQGHWVALVHP